jgi:hypothetical protein
MAALRPIGASSGGARPDNPSFLLLQREYSADDLQRGTLARGDRY